MYPANILKFLKQNPSYNIVEHDCFFLNYDKQKCNWYLSVHRLRPLIYNKGNWSLPQSTRCLLNIPQPHVLKIYSFDSDFISSKVDSEIIMKCKQVGNDTFYIYPKKWKPAGITLFSTFIDQYKNEETLKYINELITTNKLPIPINDLSIRIS